MKRPFLTKHRTSRLGLTGYHFLSTSSSSYVDCSFSSASRSQFSKTLSGVKSWLTKSEDFKSMYTSAGDTHFNGDEAGRIQEAS